MSQSSDEKNQKENEVPCGDIELPSLQDSAAYDSLTEIDKSSEESSWDYLDKKNKSKLFGLQDTKGAHASSYKIKNKKKKGEESESLVVKKALAPFGEEATLDEQRSFQNTTVELPNVAIPFVAESAASVTNISDMIDAEKKQKSEKRKRIGKISLIALGCFFALVLLFYIGVAVFFTSHFLPNTKLSSSDVSLLSRAAAEKVLSHKSSTYVLTIIDGDYSNELSADEAGLDFDATQAVDDALKKQAPWAWPLTIMGSRDLSEVVVANCDKDAIKEIASQIAEEYNADAKQPQDASLEYDSENKCFKIKPEVLGTALDADAIVEAIVDAVAKLEPKLVIGDEQRLQPKLLQDDPRLEEARKKADGMLGVDVTLKMAGNEVGKLDGEVIASWMVLTEEVEPELDGDLVSEWIGKLAEACETKGSSRSYTRPDGKDITISGGDYGWAVDRDALSEMIRNAVKEGTAGELDIPCSSEGKAYNGPGKPDWGNRYIDVDLAEQHVYFYDSEGSLIWESDCISGKPDGTHDTSVGVYCIRSMASPSKLVGYENGKKIYESTVQYWMPFVGNAIGLHDADWQPGFGGNMYAEGYGSHGCVNLPPSKAAELYGMIEIGDVVISHW